MSRLLPLIGGGARFARGIGKRGVGLRLRGRGAVGGAGAAVTGGGGGHRARRSPRQLLEARLESLGVVVELLDRALELASLLLQDIDLRGQQGAQLVYMCR